MDATARLCGFFNTPRGCREGGGCRFRHVDGAEAPRIARPCQWWASPRGCKDGDTCRYQHEGPGNVAHAASHGDADLEALTGNLRGLRVSHAGPPVGVPSARVPSSLYIDGLNFTSELWLPQMRFVYDVASMRANVVRFVQGAKAAGILHLKVFIDSSIQSGEALQKWQQRREKEVKNSDKSPPHGLSTMLGDAFEATGVPVMCVRTRT